MSDTIAQKMNSILKAAQSLWSMDGNALKVETQNRDKAGDTLTTDAVYNLKRDALDPLLDCGNDFGLATVGATVGESVQRLDPLRYDFELRHVPHTSNRVKLEIHIEGCCQR